MPFDSNPAPLRRAGSTARRWLPSPPARLRIFASSRYDAEEDAWEMTKLPVHHIIP